MSYQPQPLKFTPGIQRDGTRLDAPGNWIDGQWVRFVNGRPRKILGFRHITNAADGMPRSFENYFRGGTHYLHFGTDVGLRRLTFNENGEATSLPSARAATAYTMQGDELWQMGTAYDPIIGNAATLFAHPGRNENDISNATATSIYYGPSTGTGDLTALSGLTPVSGGICVIHPYLTFFGSDGYFGWSGPNNFNTQTTLNGGGEARPTSQKIVCGVNISGGNGPSGLYLSLNSAFRTSFVGGAQTWSFDSLSDDITIASSRAVAMGRNNVVYWLGTDAFYQFDGGQVTEVQNTYCSDWVFNNFNQAARQKAFAFANSRWGEIWFCFPFGDATESTHAAIYNYRTGEWSSTILPNGGRAGALMPGLFARPIMGCTEAVSGKYCIWQHETGYDEVRASATVAVKSFIESADVTMVTAQQPSNRSISCTGIEPDLKQEGDVTLTITGNANARSPVVDSEAFTFSPGPNSDPLEQVVRPKVDRRQMRFRWESNVAGGYYEIGLPIAHLGAGNGRETG